MSNIDLRAFFSKLDNEIQREVMHEVVNRATTSNLIQMLEASGISLEELERIAALAEMYRDSSLMK